ncbi:uncharacterized protein LOC106458627 [Limulus polyphemus]|uniref:Uncharacterized protein LOC106458627 n=1 Tax=Limulus polyphemus TaxID=6850 RepID=A0ABM1SAF1_LIMPO|nr:uncharacterized protein LOC106458627 [Limulus polyphemus]
MSDSRLTNSTVNSLRNSWVELQEDLTQRQKQLVEDLNILNKLTENKVFTEQQRGKITKEAKNFNKGPIKLQNLSNIVPRNMYSKKKGGKSFNQSADRHTGIEKRKMNMKINNPYKKNKNIIVNTKNVDEQLSKEDGPGSSNSVTESSDSSQLQSVSTQTEVGINAFTSVQVLTTPLRVVSDQEYFQRDKKLEVLTDSYVTDFSRDSAIQKDKVDRITGSRKSLKPSVMCSPSFYHKHSEVKHHLVNPSCNASSPIFVNHHKSLYHHVPCMYRPSAHYTGYHKADESHTKPNLNKSTSVHFAGHNDSTQGSAKCSFSRPKSACYTDHHKVILSQFKPDFRRPISNSFPNHHEDEQSPSKLGVRESLSSLCAGHNESSQNSAKRGLNQSTSTTIVDHHEVRHSPTRSGFSKPSSAHHFHDSNVCQKTSKSGVNDPVSAFYTDSHGSSQLQVKPGVVRVSYGSNKEYQSLESDISSSQSSPSHTSEEGREAQYFKFSVARPCSETGRSPPVRYLPRITNQYARGLQKMEVPASKDNKSMFKKKRFTPFDVSRSPATKQLTDIEKIPPEVLNKSDQYYNELRAFRQANLSECTGSETISDDDFTPTKENLGNHQCIHEYKTNERLFHVPVHCNNQGQSMCSICNLTKAEVNKKTPHQIKITLPGKRISLNKYPQFNKKKSDLNPKSLALIRNIQWSDKSRKVPCLLFH